MPETKTTIQLVEQFVNSGEYYIDTYSSYTEVGINDRDAMGGFLAALDERGIEYRMDGEDIVRVFR